MIEAEKLEAVLTALDAGTSKAAVCRTFGIARSTLIDTLNRSGRPIPLTAENP
jgi:transposase-like protein